MVYREESLRNFFASLAQINRLLSRKEIMLFLDYDGTLTPIVARPDLAVLSDQMRLTLRDVCAKHKVAIVSGRATDDVRRKVQIEGIFYAGSHGFEIIAPDGRVKVNKEARKIRPVIEKAFRKLSAALKGVRGALVEDVKYTISVHYRLVSAEDFPKVEELVDDVLRETPDLRKTRGKKVFELRPKIDWHKGKAVAWILEELRFDPEKNCAIYIGDDTTDEDAFDVVQDKGFGILVADCPRPTKARYWVHDPMEVQKVLERL